ncbi:MAG: YbbR-like domain-containing protein [Acidobacteria bacterium]|nr:YbbR-like domain-containing protein [Acidobacteriota bacterium]
MTGERHLLRRLAELFHPVLENRWLKLLSLILAILLFYFSKQPGSSIRVSGVPVEFIGVPVGMEIVNIDSPMVSLQLKGPRNLLTSLSSNEITVPVDLSNKEQGERVAHLQIRDIRLPDRIEVLNITPTALRLRLERTLSAWIGIRPRTEGLLPNGLELYDVLMNPDKILIEGPEREVLGTESLSTETVNLNGRAASFSLLVDVEVPAPLRIKGSEQITLTIRIGEERVRRIISGVPLLLRGAKETERPARLQRVAVELWGPKSLVGEIEASEISALVDVAERDQGGLAPTRPEIVLPERYRDHIAARLATAPLVRK